MVAKTAPVQFGLYLAGAEAHTISFSQHDCWLLLVFTVVEFYHWGMMVAKN